MPCIIFYSSIRFACGGGLKSALMQLYGGSVPRCRHRLRTASIRRPTRIISRGETDNARIYSKSPADTKKKVERSGRSSSTDPVHAWRVRAPSAAAYLHAAVTSADDTSAHFFSCYAYRSDPRAHTHARTHTPILPHRMSARRTGPGCALAHT